MKAILFSDLHTSKRRLTQLESEINSRRTDLGAIICAGDTLNAGGPVSFADAFIKLLGRLAVPFYWIPGNNDFGEGCDQIETIYPTLEGRVVDCGGRKLTGVAGSPLLWSGLAGSLGNMVTATEIAGTIFVSHYPPPGKRQLVFSESDLSPLFKENSNLECRMVRLSSPQISKPKKTVNTENIKNYELEIRNSPAKLAHSPLVHICGHLHTQIGLAYIGETKLVKLGAAILGHFAIMDLDTLKVEFCRLPQI